MCLLLGDIFLSCQAGKLHTKPDNLVPVILRAKHWQELHNSFSILKIRFSVLLHSLKTEFKMKP